MAVTGIRGPEFAQRNNISKSTLYRVASGEAKTPYVRKLISETIGIPEAEIWPEEKAGEKQAA